MSANTTNYRHIDLDIDDIWDKATQLMQDAYLLVKHPDASQVMRDNAALIHGKAWDIVFLASEARDDCLPRELEPWE